ELFKDDTLFTNDSGKPLADRMRPKALSDFVGQEHILGEGKILKVLIEKKDIPSMILWGPSGVGKTTLAPTMAEAMVKAYRSASPGDVVLLSPGCASFDEFKDYKERGNRFQEWVRQPKR
ncbi:MAG: hypothetical protein Q8O11_03810, partial [Syntrophales bacterium]|nr:hypothetical protein [Syntrophales bacterium]